MNTVRHHWLPLTPLLLAMMVLPLAACKTNGPGTPDPAYAMGYYLLPDETPLHEISVTRGTTLNLTVGVTNIADVPIEIRLDSDNGKGTPDTLEPQLSTAWMTLQPGEKSWFSAVYYIPANLPLGTYRMGIAGKLREPVPDRAEQSQGFKLTILDTTE